MPAATAFFRDALGLTVRVADERFAELDAGPVTIMVSSDAMVATNLAAGVILHFWVGDIALALKQARAWGATVLLEPTRTDWGWESAILAGPDALVIDLCRVIAQQ